MKIWINKCIDECPINEFKDAFVFSIKRSGSTIFTGLNDVWLMMGKKETQPLHEDLFIIGLSIFAIDKRVSRIQTFNRWTRNLEVSIPVIELETWNKVKENWESMLAFLTGDNWKLSFRESEELFSRRKRNSRKSIDVSSCTCVSLFSGGLDSFCGAIELLQKGETPCLIGHNEYPKLRTKQEALCNMFCEEYPQQKSVFVSFTANSRAPYGKEGRLSGAENTSRGRSLLFLCAAVTIAGIIGDGTTIYVPENGFIGLNIPLTNNRKGTCSTRTTHPYFIRAYNEILKMVGIKHKVINFFAFETKRSIVHKVKDTSAFTRGTKDTISCSHPCLPRYKRKGDKTYPKNCGYCYPCIIRKCSLLGLEQYDGEYSQDKLSLDFFSRHIESDTTNDMAALISSLYRYLSLDENELVRLIKCTGHLTKDEIEKFIPVYKETMKDLEGLFSQDEELKKYIGDV
jgi:7-cyano-7-deazaguanine synthase in queuosine biosynthesis